MWRGFTYNPLLMPLPALCILVPQFRYVPFDGKISVLTWFFRNLTLQWAIIANQLAISINLLDPETLSLLTLANESEFQLIRMNSRALQIYGIYTGTSS